MKNKTLTSSLATLSTKNRKNGNVSFGDMAEVRDDAILAGMKDIPHDNVLSIINTGFDSKLYHNIQYENNVKSSSILTEEKQQIESNLGDLKQALAVGSNYEGPGFLTLVFRALLILAVLGSFCYGFTLLLKSVIHYSWVFCIPLVGSLLFIGDAQTSLNKRTELISKFALPVLLGAVSAYLLYLSSGDFWLMVILIPLFIAVFTHLTAEYRSIILNVSSSYQQYRLKRRHRKLTKRLERVSIKLKKAQIGKTFWEDRKNADENSLNALSLLDHHCGSVAVAALCESKLQ